MLHVLRVSRVPLMFVSELLYSKEMVSVAKKDKYAGPSVLVEEWLVADRPSLSSSPDGTQPFLTSLHFFTTCLNSPLLCFFFPSDSRVEFLLFVLLFWFRSLECHPSVRIEACPLASDASKISSFAGLERGFSFLRFRDAKTVQTLPSCTPVANLQKTKPRPPWSFLVEML